MYNFKKEGNKAPEDPPFLALVDTVSADREKIWNAVELQIEYKGNGGTVIAHRNRLIQKMKNYFKDAIIVMSSPGRASIIAFESETNKLFHLLKQDEGSDKVDLAISKFAEVIKKEIKAVQKKRKAYVVNMDTDVSREPFSETLISLLEKVCGKGAGNNLPALLIVNMVSGLIIKSPTDLQIFLGVAMRRNKSLTTIFHKFGVCCSYDELALFKY